MRMKEKKLYILLVSIRNKLPKLKTKIIQWHNSLTGTSSSLILIHRSYIATYVYRNRTFPMFSPYIQVYLAIHRCIDPTHVPTYLHSNLKRMRWIYAELAGGCGSSLWLHVLLYVGICGRRFISWTICAPGGFEFFIGSLLRGWGRLLDCGIFFPLSIRR